MKFVKSFLLYSLFTITSTGFLYAQTSDKITAGISNSRLERYENFLKSQVDQGQIPGAVSLVMRNGEVVFEAALGYSSIADKRPMEVDDIFFIQSMTKPIISVAFMMLYEEGHFLLTDPVSKYLPAFKEISVIKDVNDGMHGETEAVTEEITIAHLLTHTAGLAHGIGSSQLAKDIGEQQYMQTYSDIQSRVNNLLSMPLMGQPGKQWYYSAAPDVLSVLIAQFSGMSTNDFLMERIFKPLKMDDTNPPFFF
ncbi:MAG: CubicO group peptidase (beta-lactamase class C family) [Saprospiraceae bacterium]|jgi:CubicO group peptidase (beta-lactamase class C family)